jgi:hypothetical protein
MKQSMLGVTALSTEPIAATTGLTPYSYNSNTITYNRTNTMQLQQQHYNLQQNKHHAVTTANYNLQQS